MYCGAVEFVCSPAAVRHIPVLLEECLSFLSPEAGGSFADLTFGGGGHSRSILAANPDVSLLAMDCDPDASLRAESVKDEFGERFRFQDARFSKIDQFSAEGEFNGVLMDLGISSFQLMEPSKGFHSNWTPDRHEIGSERGAAQSFWRPRSGESYTTQFAGGETLELAVNAIVDARGTGILKRTMSAAELFRMQSEDRGAEDHPATRLFRV